MSLAIPTWPPSVPQVPPLACSWCGWTALPWSETGCPAGRKWSLEVHGQKSPASAGHAGAPGGVSSWCGLCCARCAPEQGRNNGPFSDTALKHTCLGLSGIRALAPELRFQRHLLSPSGLRSVAARSAWVAPWLLSLAASPAPLGFLRLARGVAPDGLEKHRPCQAPPLESAPGATRASLVVWLLRNRTGDESDPPPCPRGRGFGVITQTRVAPAL